MSVLEVQNLRVYYESVWGDYKAVDGASFKTRKNEVFSIAGESGCGKSTLVDGILRLIKPPGHIPSGKVIFEGTNLLRIPEDELRGIRWVKMAYVPQGAMNSLNPIIKVEEQMTDAILDHGSMSKEEARELAGSMLKEVSLPVEVARMYPHELSGGMKQRVIIATAIALKPILIIADEPTTALDVVVQKGILQLLESLKEKYGITVIVVSHDMAAHAQVAERIAIMYAGKVVEIGSIYDVFEQPLHPYTKGLISAIPAIGKKYVKSIPGLAPSPLNWPQGCRFHPRCPHAVDICSEVEPTMKEVSSERYVACHLYE
ncbi:MAG: ABC transporter ATP-binding protein [Candidatus Bathyarchaeota archaeon]|nr:ABC transporter ATP-binding protein [Candidatus Bathyarchaeota archaeon]